MRSAMDQQLRVFGTFRRNDFLRLCCPVMDERSPLCCYVHRWVKILRFQPIEAQFLIGKSLKTTTRKG